MPGPAPDERAGGTHAAQADALRRQAGQFAALGSPVYARLAERLALDPSPADGRPLAWVSARSSDEREGEREDAWELELRVWPGPMRHVAHLDFHGNRLDWLG